MSEHINVDKLKQQHAKKDLAPITEEFVKEHMGLVEALVSNIIVKSKPPAGIDFEDMVGWGVEGLIKAFRNFDDSKGSQFKTYAYYRIRGEIMDKIRLEWKMRNPFEYGEYQLKIQKRIADVVEGSVQEGDLAGKSSDDMVQTLVSNSAMVYLMSVNAVGEQQRDSRPVDPDIGVVDDQESMLMGEVKLMDEDEKEFIHMFYVQGLRQKEIAKKLKCSNSTVSRMHAKIIEKLKQRVETRMKKEEND